MTLLFHPPSTGLFLAILLVFNHLVYAESFSSALVAAAIERTQHKIEYDGSYVALEFPGGDVPSHKGVCTDVLIRAYRAIGADLQQEVHNDMSNHFDSYPSKRIWGLSVPDSNIDHRRVPNLQVFFARNGKELSISTDGEEYRPGDIVTWMLPGNLPHIGLVTDRHSTDRRRPLIVHNIGAGPTLEDMLFNFKITGHYRYKP